MFIYTENDTESDKRIQNNSFKYKTHQQYKNTFVNFHQGRNFQKKTENDFIIYQNSIVHILNSLYVLYILYVYMSILFISSSSFRRFSSIPWFNSFRRFSCKCSDLSGHVATARRSCAVVIAALSSPVEQLDKWS